jgi:hypothetical protein
MRNQWERTTGKSEVDVNWRNQGITLVDHGECKGDVTPVIAPCETNGQVLMPHRRMRGKMTAYDKRQSAAEGLRPLALRCQRRLHLP